MEHVKPAEQSRDSSGRFCGSGAFPSPISAAETTFTPLNSVAQTLRTALEDAHYVLESVAAEEDKVAVAICRASPGAGKSTLARRLLSERVADGDEGRVMFHVPTLALAEEAAEDARSLGLAAIAVRGRSAATPAGDGTMCAKSELIDRASRIGISARDHFCETTDEDGKIRRCPHFDACPYLEQFRTDASHLFLATRYLSLPDPGHGTCVSRIVDETFWKQFISIGTISAASFSEPRTFLPQDKSAQHADLLATAKELVAKLIAGRSPLELAMTSEEFREMGRLEWQNEAPRPGIAPDQSSKKQSAALARAELNHRQNSRFSAIWTILADAREAGLDQTERLRCFVEDDKHLIQIMRRKPLKHDQPMVVLDADADAEILRALGCDVLAESTVSLRPNATIRQLHDRRMTTGALLRQPALRECWRRIIVGEVLCDRAGKGGGVLVGASRKVVRAFFEDAGHDFSGLSEEALSSFMLDTPLYGAHWLWFGGRSLGSNRYQECSSVIAIGREELPVAALEDQAAAIWGDTPGAPLEYIASDQQGRRIMPEVETPYEMTDGSQMSVLVPHHPDPRVRRLQLQTRELATRQLAERLRLARAQQPKRVLIGCNVPIPGMPVDALLSWQDLCVERVDAAVSDGLLAHGGVRLSVDGLAEAAPKVFANASSAKDYLKRRKDVRQRLKTAESWREAGGVQIVRLRMNRPHAREELALLSARSFEEARCVAERLWGPLRECRPA